MSEATMSIFQGCSNNKGPLVGVISFVAFVVGLPDWQTDLRNEED